MGFTGNAPCSCRNLLKEYSCSGILVLLDIDAKEFVLKAQILAGGRGKGTFTSGLQGGVHLTTE